jgi:glycine C-acetyltransferase
VTSREDFLGNLRRDIDVLRRQGLYKIERVMASPQRARVRVDDRDVLNLCANNYLGLADHPMLVQTAKEALDRWGFGVASVRFICGTQPIHRELERRLSEFLGTEDTILYSSCFDANGGLFETLLNDRDAVVSDALNHASIIDGVRLCSAKRYRYANNDMADLRSRLTEARADGADVVVIATDGVFSMDGVIADLASICDLADEFDALVMVDDSHAVGFVGPTGRGSAEACGVMDRIDIFTGTLGKALGGASGGYTSGRREVVEWLRQRSRPYLFSNSLAPSLVATSIAVLDLLDRSPELRAAVHANAEYFRAEMDSLGFELSGSGHAIIPVMLGDAPLALEFASRMLDNNVFVIGFTFPVVPRDTARIRTQMSAAHHREDLDAAVASFGRVGRELGVIR